MKVPQMPTKGGRNQTEISLELKVVTPIFGGASVTREVDSIDIIRAPSIRGHLRFWWRALHAQDCESSRELHVAESQLWGGPTVKGVEGVGRSRVELRVDCLRVGEVTRADSFEGSAAYALFPGRAQTGDGTPAAKIRLRGTHFRLRLRLPNDRAREVSDSLRAWVLFGGYGGRTRRGLGSLTVVGDVASWLPKSPNVAAISELFGRNVFAPPRTAAGQTPLLAGARLFSSYEEGNPTYMWSKAVEWLVEFRQGNSGPRAARKPGKDNRPSISNWPEADKVRHLSAAKLPWAHDPRHNEIPAWPRAGFGLPIMGQFQARSRDKKTWEQGQPPSTEPGDYRIGWRRDGQVQERLASPLILKPLALAAKGDSQRFTPIALWLARAHPDGEVILQRENGEVVEGSAAPFERLLAPGDPALFDGLVGQDNLKGAFFAWLEKHGRPQQQRKTNKRQTRKRGRR